MSQERQLAQWVFLVAGDARQAKYVVPGRGVARLRRAEFAHLPLRVESATDLADTDTADHASAATASVVRASVSFNGAHIADTRRVALEAFQANLAAEVEAIVSLAV